MGTYGRPKPRRLAEKLLRVRKAFAYSQNDLIRRFGLTDQITQSDVSAFERGKREPPLFVLLKYSENARVWVNAFIDDEVDLPEVIPSKTISAGIPLKESSVMKNHIRSGR